MYNLATICFMCLTESKCLKTLYNNEQENDAAKQIKYILPEIRITDMKIAVHICCGCHTAIQNFHSFKTRCLDNYYRLINYINTSQTTNNIQKVAPVKEVVPPKEIVPPNDNYYRLLNFVNATQASNNIQEVAPTREVLPPREVVPTRELVPPKENKTPKLPEPERDIEFVELEQDDPLLSFGRRDDLNLLTEDMDIKEELFDSEDSDDQGDDRGDERGDDEDSCQPIQFIKCEVSESDDQQDSGASKSDLPTDIIMEDFECTICKKKFTRHRDFKDHMKSNHEGIHIFICCVCNKGLSKKITELHLGESHLKKHEIS